MSVELRMAVTGDCRCGTPHPVSDGLIVTKRKKASCQHELVCEWGILENTSADPLREGGPRHLMLITPEHAQLLQFQPHIGPYGDIDSATVVDERVFVHKEFNGHRWTWELFDAHWWDGQGPEILIGRWPD